MIILGQSEAIKPEMNPFVTTHPIVCFVIKKFSKKTAVNEGSVAAADNI